VYIFTEMKMDLYRHKNHSKTYQERTHMLTPPEKRTGLTWSHM